MDSLLSVDAVRPFGRTGEAARPGEYGEVGDRASIVGVGDATAGGRLRR
jgi:hypothetical protein